MITPGDEDDGGLAMERQQPKRRGVSNTRYDDRTDPRVHGIHKTQLTQGRVVVSVNVANTARTTRKTYFKYVAHHKTTWWAWVSHI